MVHHGAESSEFLMMALALRGSCSSTTSLLQRMAARSISAWKGIDRAPGGRGLVEQEKDGGGEQVKLGFGLAHVCVPFALRPLTLQSQSG